MAEGAQASQDRRHKRKAKTVLPPANMVVLAEHQAFARSFDEFFVCGMALIDEIQLYFNRPSVKIAAETASPYHLQARKRLSAAAMQMASWLWLERALREGDITPAAAAGQKKTLHFVILPPGSAGADGAEGMAGRAESAAAAEAVSADLPAEFRNLYSQVAHFIGRIQLMDKETESFSRHLAMPPRNPLGSHWQALESAFGSLNCSCKTRRS